MEGRGGDPALYGDYAPVLSDVDSSVSGSFALLRAVDGVADGVSNIDIAPSAPAPSEFGDAPLPHESASGRPPMRKLGRIPSVLDVSPTVSGRPPPPYSEYHLHRPLIQKIARDLEKERREAEARARDDAKRKDALRAAREQERLRQRAEVNRQLEAQRRKAAADAQRAQQREDATDGVMAAAGAVAIGAVTLPAVIAFGILSGLS